MDRFHEQQQTEPARRGTVLISTGDGVHVSSCVDGAYLEQILPYGIFSMPCEKDEVMLLPSEDGKYVLLGKITASVPVNPGEIMIKAKSGACIYLKADGSVEINGLVISADGTIQN